MTDDQCNEFRRLPCNFNDMVRAIWQAAMAHERDECAKVCEERSRWIADVIVPELSPEFRGADSFANGSWQEAEMCAAAIRARSGE